MHGAPTGHTAPSSTATQGSALLGFFAPTEPSPKQTGGEEGIGGAGIPKSLWDEAEK